MIDLQVNGYAGVDFNGDDLTGDALHRACDRLAGDGVDAILATVITDDLDAMCARLARLAALRAADPLAARLIAGVHIEGPFLNEQPGFRGAHPLDAIQPASAAAMTMLLDAAAGLTRLVTLAPERDPGFVVTRLLAFRGIVVSAGHTDASLAQLKDAADAGLSMCTHVGNGCPMQLPRHDNIIQRMLAMSDRLWLSFIADGVHVPFFALRNFFRAAGLDRCIVVSDAMPAAGLGPGRYSFGRWNLDVGEDLAAWAPDRSHLVGSAVTMKRSAENLAASVGLSTAEVARVTSANPRTLLGLGV